MFKPVLFAAALVASASAVSAADTYALDASHSQVLFNYNHLGFSTTFGMFSGFEGEILLDAENPAASSVTVSMPTLSMFTGWEKREAHFMSGDFFGATEDDVITFASTSVELTGDETAKITGDLTMNDVTKSVVLDATLNKKGPHPRSGVEWAGFNASTTLVRSEFGLGIGAPFVSDEVEVMISVEAMKVE
ncbi:YceI family protein [Roseobacter sp.]|uniref:YceI family protein n=1 Tax=Roseobacter sp. TaxID=1907202 RepID=UPI003297447F